MRIEGSVALVGRQPGGGQSLHRGAAGGGGGQGLRGCARSGQHHRCATVPVPLDVTSPTQIKAASRVCPDVTLLINNAEIMLLSPVLAEGAEEALRQEMETNVYGPLALARAFAPILAHNGGGALVNMLSVVSWFTNPFNATYCASSTRRWR